MGVPSLGVEPDAGGFLFPMFTRALEYRQGQISLSKNLLGKFSEIAQE